MNMKLSSQGFLVHRNINTRENKAQIPLIIHHNEKTPKYISDVKPKIIELHKLVKWLKEKSSENSNFHHHNIKNFQST